MNVSVSGKEIKVFIEGGGFGYERMFQKRGFIITNKFHEADLICFTGGEDVDPSLYNQAKHPRTNYNSQRDELCMEMYNYAIINNIPMCGICRGSQFLCVANGGELWQHVDNHAVFGTHKATTDTGEVIDVTSTHHQMMRPNGVNGADFKLLLTAKLSVKKHRMVNGEVVVALASAPDVECVLWEQTRSLGYQPHPEFQGAPKECTDFFFDKLNLILE